ncbi:MAG: ABC transporter ATP-binding protein [Sedimentisphaerales bacterium]
MNMEKHTILSQSIRPLLSLLRRYFFSRSQLAISFILVLFLAATDLVCPWLVMQAIDIIVKPYEHNLGTTDTPAEFYEILWVAGALVVIVLVQYAARYLLVRIQNRLMYQGGAKLRAELYSRLQAQALAFYARRQLGNLITNLVTDVQMLQDMTLELASDIPFDACILGGLLVAMFIINKTLALPVIIFLMIVFVLAVRIGRGGLKNQERAMDAAAAFTSRVQESLGGMRVIQSFGAVAQEQAGVEAMANNHAQELQEAGEVRATVTPFFGLSEYTGILIVLIIGGWCALRGTLTAGGFVAFLAYMEMAADPISRIAEVFPKALKAVVAAQRVERLLAETQLLDTPGVATPRNIAGEIHVKGLSFTYPGEKEALHNLNFVVKPGERVAVVGPNGSGKSTLFDILLKLLVPTKGAIDVDGIDLRGISKEEWCRIAGVVPQDVLLLNRTIAENIALGLARLGDVQQAAQLAGVDEAIMRLPKGYDTLPGERGVCLSGGERQRIAIARVFLRDPRIILLDEPTAALDLLSEAQILPPLSTLCTGRTTFIVSHRAALLERVDKVLLLSEGRQVAFDTPENIWRAQVQYQALFPPSWNGQDKSRPVKQNEEPAVVVKVIGSCKNKGF